MIATFLCSTGEIALLAIVETVLREAHEQARIRESSRAANQKMKKDWISAEDMREINGYQTDVVPHASVLETIDRDDIRYAVRAELGRDFDTASLSLSDGDPERWYDEGEEIWEPEEPKVIDDIDIHRNAVRQAREREAFQREFNAFPKHRGPRNLDRPFDTTIKYYEDFYA